jgi:hypothetical protein
MNRVSNELAFVLGIIINAPIIEINNPIIIVFLYPILFTISYFKYEEPKYKNNDPRKYAPKKAEPNN